jgi:integrase
MGRNSTTGGVAALGHNRIMYDFVFEGRRCRPTLVMPPTTVNLRRARESLQRIRVRIAAGTFSFADEFPDYRHLRKVVDSNEIRTCNRVFDEFLEHCEARRAKHDLAEATLRGYRKAIDRFWRPRLGEVMFLKVRYSELVRMADAKRNWSKKTYNNAVSVLRRAFAFGYRDYPYQANPASGLRGARFGYRDRPRIDPFRIQDAETLIAAIHQDWGEAQGNYDEFRFFTGMRPSEQIALTIRDLDVERGSLWVCKSKVHGVQRHSTKTGQDRLIRLCSRALAVAKRQLALYHRLRSEAAIRHDYLFFTASGEPIESVLYTGDRWRSTLKRLPIRYRRPYCARHTSVSWNLVVGKNPLYVSRQHGHSVETMWRTYSSWMEGAFESDIQLIRAAMDTSSTSAPNARPSTHQSTKDRGPQTPRFPGFRGFGNGFANRNWESSIKWLKSKIKKVAERVGFDENQ